MGCCHATSRPLIFFENKCVLMKITLVTPFIHMPDTEGIASPRCFWTTLIWPGLTTLFTTAQFLLSQNWSSDEWHFIHYKAVGLHLSAQNFLNISSEFTKSFLVPKPQRTWWGMGGWGIPCGCSLQCSVRMTSHAPWAWLKILPGWEVSLKTSWFWTCTSQC